MAAIDKAVAAREDLAGSDAKYDYSDALARTYFNKAGLLLQLNRQEAALDEYSKALALLLPLVYSEGRNDVQWILAKYAHYQSKRRNHSKKKYGQYHRVHYPV